VSRRTGGLTLNAGSPSPANIVQADIMASSSVIHLTDSIIVPPYFYSLFSPYGPDNFLESPAERLSRISVASIYFNAAKAIPSYFNVLSKTDTKVTMFVPTDSAFAALPPAMLAFLKDPANAFHANELLVYHVIKASVFSYNDGVSYVRSQPNSMVSVATGFDTYDMMLKINSTGGLAIYSGIQTPASVIKPDLVGGQSIIHLIDTVLIPPTSTFLALLTPLPTPGYKAGGEFSCSV
jgi:uncharacterized surface protein with fasciclin (FAS1) repeats